MTSLIRKYNTSLIFFWIILLFGQFRTYSQEKSLGVKKRERSKIVTQSGVKKALLIGNSHYALPSLDSLQFVGKDISLIKESLKSLGFITHNFQNADGKSLELSLNIFLNTLGEGDFLLIYYTGHGFSLNNSVYLIPTDFPSECAENLPKFGYNLNTFVSKLNQKALSNLIVLFDGCYTNSIFECSKESLKQNFTLSSSGNLNQGSFVFFSSKKNDIPSSAFRSEENGLMASSLLNNIQLELSLKELLDSTARSMRKKTRLLNLAENDLYFEDRLYQDIFLNGKIKKSYSLTTRTKEQAVELQRLKNTSKLLEVESEGLHQSWSDFEKGQKAFLENNYSEAFSYFSMASENNHMEATMHLALMYLNGQGTSVNEKEAFRLLNIAAESGDKISQNHLGKMYLLGLGCKKNIERALYWLNKAATQKEIESQRLLGQLHLNGWNDVQVDIKLGEYWLREAATLGDTLSQFDLGVHLMKDQKIPKKFKEGFHWLEKAALNENTKAQYIMGMLYTLNEGGIRPDSKKSYSWFLRAAKHDHPESCYYVAVMNLNGELGRVNQKVALEYMRKAAFGGYGDAQFKLGNYYYLGDGVKQSIETGIYWYKKASKQGHPEAKRILNVLRIPYD